MYVCVEFVFRGTCKSVFVREFVNRKRAEKQEDEEKREEVQRMRCVGEGEDEEVC